MSENRGRKKEKERKEKVFSSKFFGIFPCIQQFNVSNIHDKQRQKNKKNILNIRNCDT
jgi:hypothetical protein